MQQEKLKRTGSRSRDHMTLNCRSAHINCVFFRFYYKLMEVSNYSFHVVFLLFVVTMQNRWLQYLQVVLFTCDVALGRVMCHKGSVGGRGGGGGLMTGAAC